LEKEKVLDFLHSFFYFTTFSEGGYMMAEYVRGVGDTGKQPQESHSTEAFSLRDRNIFLRVLNRSVNY
jgi:hypothetical protein